MEPSNDEDFKIQRTNIRNVQTPITPNTSKNSKLTKPIQFKKTVVIFILQNCIEILG